MVLVLGRVNEAFLCLWIALFIKKAAIFLLLSLAFIFDNFELNYARILNNA